MSDPINPDHYRQGKVECIDAIESATVNKTGIEAACTANIIKYLWRYESKNGLQDVKKARWYLDRLISVLEQQQAATQAEDPCDDITSPEIADDGEDWQTNHGFQVEHPPTLDPFDFVIVEFRHGRTEVGLAKWYTWYHSAKYPYFDIIRYRKVPE